MTNESAPVIKKAPKKRHGAISWDGYVHKLFVTMAGDQCTLKKHTCKVLASMLDDLICKIGAEASSLCKASHQQTMKPASINKGILLYCGRTELTKIVCAAGTKALSKYQNLNS